MKWNRERRVLKTNIDRIGSTAFCVDKIVINYFKILKSYSPTFATIWFFD